MQKFLAICRTFFRWLGWLEEGLLCLLLTVMILLACVQIGLRFFHGGLVWADPLLRYLVLWTGLLGGAVATKHGNHIRIDLASHLLPPVLQRWLQVLLDLVSALVCGVLTRVSVTFVRNEAAFGGPAELFAIPGWMLYLVFPLVFGVMSCRFLIAAVTAFRTALFQPAGPESSAVSPSSLTP